MSSAGVVLVVLGVVAVVAIAVAVVVVRRRRRARTTLAPAAPSTDTAPIGGLEAALDGVIGRDGRPMREKIDAEAAQVESLRTDDDTGPLLRRALDHVAGDGSDRDADRRSPSGEPAAGPAPDPADDPAGDSGGDPR